MENIEIIFLKKGLFRNIDVKNNYDFKNCEKNFVNLCQSVLPEKEFKIYQDVKNFFLIREIIQSLKIRAESIEKENIFLQELFQEFYKNDFGKDLKIGELFNPGSFFVLSE